MTGFKRIFLFVFIFVLLVYGSTGLYYASYSPETSDRYLWGAYHVHSARSDGLLSIPEIRRTSPQNARESSAPHRPWPAQLRNIHTTRDH